MKRKAIGQMLFWLGAGFIVLSYLGSLWIWTRTHDKYEGNAKTERQIQLLGYSFLFVTALFLCLYIGQPHLTAMAEVPVVSGESILVSFTAGWFFLFLSHYRAEKKAL
jgi:hypothetical protein